MASNKMATNCSDIEKAAELIRNENDHFTSLYKGVFEAFRTIDTAWDGADNASFNESVMSFEKDFLVMTAYFEDVEKHLRLSAKAYKAIESANKKSAGSLSM